jgi:hypothetical protein
MPVNSFACGLASWLERDRDAFIARLDDDAMVAAVERAAVLLGSEIALGTLFWRDPLISTTRRLGLGIQPCVLDQGGCGGDEILGCVLSGGTIPSPL